VWKRICIAPRSLKHAARWTYVASFNFHIIYFWFKNPRVSMKIPERRLGLWADDDSSATARN